MDDNLSIVEQKQKNHTSKLLQYLIKSGTAITIAECARMLNISLPTATNLIETLCDEEVLLKEGKNDSTFGRKATVFKINKKAGNFIGVEVKQYKITIGSIDMSKAWVGKTVEFDFALTNSEKSLQELLVIIHSFIKKSNIKKDKILGICVISPGRVNTINGSNINYFNFLDVHLETYLTEQLGCVTIVDNDTRASAIGEYYQANKYTEKNILYINFDYGLGMSLIIGGKLFYGKNGYSGEIGHTFFADNNILCHCGKSGCLETEVSGRALLRLVKENILQGKASQLKISDELTLEDIVKAILNNDSLGVNLIEQMSSKLGVVIANLINVFNPDVIVFGGIVSQTKDYMLLPIKTAIRKYCLKAIAEETKLYLADENNVSGVYGACLLALEKKIN
ncbi:glucokinase-like [Rhinoderma darwinii]|uniref:glucokinase-like n=1 Tax=Rhinoderma darwinii TaxID=43563 RepID=UPI003F66DD62